MRHVIALFGEAEKGSLQRGYRVQKLPELLDLFGNPPEESEGLFFAIQALLYERELVFFRVSREGFSKEEYFFGASYLEKDPAILHALCLPGVGDREVLEAFSPLCERHRSPLLVTQRDFFDYLWG